MGEQRHWVDLAMDEVKSAMRRELSHCTSGISIFVPIIGMQAEHGAEIVNVRISTQGEVPVHAFIRLIHLTAEDRTMFHCHGIVGSIGENTWVWWTPQDESGA